jgi:hypothetical protein
MQMSRVSKLKQGGINITSNMCTSNMCYATPTSIDKRALTSRTHSLHHSCHRWRPPNPSPHHTHTHTHPRTHAHTHPHIHAHTQAEAFAEGDCTEREHLYYHAMGLLYLGEFGSARAAVRCPFSISAHFRSEPLHSRNAIEFHAFAPLEALPCVMWPRVCLGLTLSYRLIPGIPFKR